MSRKIDADPSYLTKSSPVVTVYPFTAFASFLPNTLNKIHHFFSCSDEATGVNFWGMNYTGNILQAFVHQGAGQQNANTTNAATLNAWNTAAMVYTSATDRTAILNADFANKGTSTVNTTPSGLDNTTLGVLATSTIFGGDIDFLLANVAVWNVALVDDEISALDRGVFPRDIRPGALLAHWPLWGNKDPEIVHGPKASDGFQMSLVSAPAKGDHRASKLWTPNRPSIVV